MAKHCSHRHGFTRPNNAVLANLVSLSIYTPMGYKISIAEAEGLPNLTLRYPSPLTCTSVARAHTHRTAGLRRLAFLPQLNIQAREKVVLTTTRLPLWFVHRLIILKFRSLRRPVPYGDGMYDLIAKTVGVLYQHPSHTQNVRTADHRFPSGPVFFLIIWREECLAWPRRRHAVCDSFANERVAD